MCGIAVAVNWSDAELTVEKLIQGIVHRGDVTDPVVAPAEHGHGHTSPAHC
jgi:asparagine synthetase B (glutamine-hydrolysing)